MGSAIVEFLADRAIEDYEPMKFDFPDEDVMMVSRERMNQKKKVGGCTSMVLLIF